MTSYPVVGTDDQTSPPAENDVAVDVPAAGPYPIGVDYTECRQGELALTLGSPYGDPLLPGTISSLPADQCRTPTDSCCTSIQATFGGPFNSRTGNLWASTTALSVPSAGPTLAWARSYNSPATGDSDVPGLLGHGWQEPYATHLITAGVPGGEPSAAIIVSPSGNGHHRL